MFNKNVLKLIICQLAFYSGFLHLYIKFSFLKKASYPAVIINYHSFVRNLDNVIEIGPSVSHKIEDFRKEVCFLKKYFEIVSLDTLIENLKNEQKFSRPTIAITVDDGYRDNYELLYPVAKAENIPVTIFLTAGYINTTKRIWVNRLSEAFLHTPESVFRSDQALGAQDYMLNSMDQRRSAYLTVLSKMKNMNIEQRDQCLRNIEESLGKSPNGQPVMLSWEQVREMQNNNIYFGAHTCYHPILTNMPIEEAKKEIAFSKEVIEQQLKVTIKHFAYPNGRKQDFNEDLREFCSEIGFESVSTCDYGHNIKSSDAMALKRIGPPLPMGIYAVNVIRAFSNKEHEG